VKIDRLPSWKDKEKRILRILPSKAALQFYLDSEDEDAEFEDEAMPYQELRTHFKVGSQNQICACLNFWNDEDCPVCEEIAALKETGDKKDKYTANDMWASQRFARFVLWKNSDEPKKVWLWECSKTVDTDVMALYMDTRIPDPDLLFEGTDIEVTRHGMGQKDTTYRVSDTREVSFMVTTEDGEFDWEAAEEINNVLPDIFEHGKPFLNYEETKLLVEGSTLQDVIALRNGEEGEETGETPPYGNDDEPEDKPKPVRGAKSGRPTRGKRGSK